MLILLLIAKTAILHRTRHMDSTTRTTSIMAHHNRCSMDTRALPLGAVIPISEEVITRSHKVQTADSLPVKGRLQTSAINHRREEEGATFKTYSGPPAEAQEVAGIQNHIARLAPIKGNPIVQLFRRPRHRSKRILKTTILSVLPRIFESKIRDRKTCK